METARIVLIGATGYTGRLVARELAARGARFVLAGRDADRLRSLAARLTGAGPEPEHRTVDVTDPSSLARLTRAGDAVINCAGPFAVLGEPVIRACIDAGAHYVDTTGEQPWMRRMHERYDAAARTAGIAVVNGMAFEYALGDCAIAVAAAGLPRPLHAVDVIYAWAGSGSSRGTRRTALRMAGARAWQLEQGAWRRRAVGARRRRFRFGSGRCLTAVAFGAGEVVTVPRWTAARTVRGWLVMGRRTARVVSLISPALPLIVPPLRPLLEPLLTRAAEPGPDERRASRFTIRIEIEAPAGRRSAVEVRGRDPYGITAAIAVAGAERALEPGAPAGVLAPSQLVEPRRFLEALQPLGLAPLSVVNPT